MGDITTSDTPAFAKLSDEQINSVAMSNGDNKIFKLKSTSGDAKDYYMMSQQDFNDVDKGFGLLPVHWNDNTHIGTDWTEVNSCVGSSQERIDTECLYGNTCNRIFFDYHGVPGCFPAQGQRCANDGAPCGHKLIADFEMWIFDPPPPTPSCGNIITVGNELIDRETPDGASNIQFVDLHLPFGSSGRLLAWDWFAGRPGDTMLQIWRPDTETCDTTCFTLVCENAVTAATTGPGHFDVDPADQCVVNADDVIGWFHLGQGVQAAA